MYRAALILLALLLHACAPQQAAQQVAQRPAAVLPPGTVTAIKIDGVDYGSTRDALDGLRRSIDSRLGGIVQEADPLSGQARVVLPDRDRLRPVYAQLLAQRLKRVLTGEALEFEIDVERLRLQALADALARSREFQAVRIVEQNDTREPEIGDAQYLVWYQVRNTMPDNSGPWLARWLVRRAGNRDAEPAGVDPGVAAGTPRYASFVQSVRGAALRLGGKSLAGTTAGSLAGGQRQAIGNGSGIIVGAGGQVLTNDHVIRRCGEVEVVDTANQTWKAAIAARDAGSDLALLQVAHRWPSAVTFRDGRAPQPGESLVVTGYPLSGLLGSGMAVTTGSLTALTGPRDDQRLLQISAGVQPGNSGGPVLDSEAALIGVVSGTLNSMAVAAVTGGAVPQNTNFAIKADVARSFLDSHGVAYKVAPARAPLSAAQVAEHARGFTVRVDCR